MRIRKGTLVLLRNREKRKDCPFGRLALVKEALMFGEFVLIDCSGYEFKAHEPGLAFLVQTNSEIRTVRQALKRHSLKIIERLLLL